MRLAILVLDGGTSKTRANWQGVTPLPFMPSVHLGRHKSGASRSTQSISTPILKKMKKIIAVRDARLLLLVWAYFCSLNCIIQSNASMDVGHLVSEKLVAQLLKALTAFNGASSKNASIVFF